MQCARTLRKLFPRPKRFPNIGISIERYLMFDTNNAPPYKLPDGECDLAFILQVSGKL